MTKHSFLAGGAILAVAALTPGVALAKPKPKPTKYCVAKTIGFQSHGRFVSGSWTQTQGAGTETRRDDRYSGEITVNVKRANHRAPRGEQTYTFTNAKLKLRPNGHTAVAGDKVHVFGKLTRVRGKNCTNPGVVSQTARKIIIKKA